MSELHAFLKAEWSAAEAEHARLQAIEARKHQAAHAAELARRQAQQEKDAAQKAMEADRAAALKSYRDYKSSLTWSGRLIPLAGVVFLMMSCGIASTAPLEYSRGNPGGYHSMTDVYLMRGFRWGGAISLLIGIAISITRPWWLAGKRAILVNQHPKVENLSSSLKSLDRD